MKRGRVTAHFIVNRSSGREEDDGRRDPGREDVGRRALVAHRVSACGAANFEEVPGREQYGAGDDATAQWVENMLAFHEENSTTIAISARSTSISRRVMQRRPTATVAAPANNDLAAIPSQLRSQAGLSALDFD